MKHQKIKLVITYLLTAGLLAGVIGLSAFFAAGFGIGAARSLVPGEQLIDKNDLPPESGSKTYTSGSDNYNLELTFDSTSISPLPGSSISGHLRLLKNGRPMETIPAELSDPKTRPTAPFYLSHDNEGPLVVLDLDKLGQNLYAGQVVIDDNKPDRAGEFGGAGSRLTWKPVTAYSTNLVDLNARLVSEQLKTVATSSGNTGPTIRRATFRFNEARVDFTYYHDGIRLLPYLPFKFMTGGSTLEVEQPIWFSDQIGHGVKTPHIKTQQTSTDTYYQISASPSRVASGSSQTIKLTIEAKDKDTKQPHTNIYQRVKITAVPLQRVFVPDRVTASEDFKQRFGQPTNRFQGKVEIATAGSFILNSDLARLHGIDLINTPDDAGWVEADLINGKAEVEFSYTGATGVLPYIAFIVQPANFFIPYPGWERLESSGNGLEHKVKPENEVPAMSNRESASLTYPDVEQAVQARCDTPSHPGLRCDTHYLYDGKWMTSDDFYQLVNTTFTVVEVPIGGLSNILSAQLAIWVWFLLMHASQLIIGGTLILISRRRRLI